MRCTDCSVRSVRRHRRGAQEHVSEYGVHWNFFFTLAAVSLLAGLCNVSETKGAIYGLLLSLGGRPIPISLSLSVLFSRCPAAL
jgi:hypothetical protein